MAESSVPEGRDAAARWPAPGSLVRWIRVPVGVALGVLTAVAELLFLLAVGLGTVAALPAPKARRALGATTRGLAERIVAMEQRRLVAFAPDSSYPVRYAAGSGQRAFAYLAARLLPGALGALLIGLLAVGVVLAGVLLRGVAVGSVTLPSLLSQVLYGTALLVLNLQAIATTAAVDRWLARTLLAPSARELLERRVSELATSRAGVVAAVDSERQRIERDLHDGLQQRLVALGMLLGRARRSRDAEKVHELVRQAHEDAQRAIDDLREVAWRVYPSALDHSSLDEVLAMVAQGSSVPVKITCELPVRPARQVETVLYFVACEAITNAAKHAGASLITVEISGWGTVVEMRVHDDGVGGADPAGSGLSGLARRVAALDGEFHLDSPPGGPTTVRVELPCG